ncbi:DDE family transposase [Streptomyces sp. Ag109_G2-6]|nr:DDE family transposase [Streptomyces sp. Ag109_G2-6]
MAGSDPVRGYLYSSGSWTDPVARVVERAREIVDGHAPLKVTLRQVMYRLAAEGVLPHTPPMYRRLVLATHHAQRLGRHRWVVERTVSWLAGCRRLHRRYERKAEHFLAFVGIASALICQPQTRPCGRAGTVSVRPRHWRPRLRTA